MVQASRGQLFIAVLGQGGHGEEVEGSISLGRFIARNPPSSQPVLGKQAIGGMELGEAGVQAAETGTGLFFLDLLLGEENITKLGGERFLALHGSEDLLCGGNVACGKCQGDIVKIGLVRARGDHFADGLLHTGEGLLGCGWVEPKRGEVETVRLVGTSSKAARTGKERFIRLAAPQEFETPQIRLHSRFAPAVGEAAPHRGLANEVRGLALPAGELRIDLLRSLLETFIITNFQTLAEAVEARTKVMQEFIKVGLERLLHAPPLNFVPGDQVTSTGPLTVEFSAVLIDGEDGPVRDQFESPQDDPISRSAIISRRGDYCGAGKYGKSKEREMRQTRPVTLRGLTNVTLLAIVGPTRKYFSYLWFFSWQGNRGIGTKNA